MKKIRVAVICGGVSSEREISLKSGGQIFASLPRKSYEPSCIEITKEGRWFAKSGKTAKEILPTRAYFKKFDVAFIGMHGAFGEDGKIQTILEGIGIPYTGSGVLASALGMNKIKTLDMVGMHGVPVAKYIPLYQIPKSAKERIKLAVEVQKQIGFPCVVKPNESGSSVGISLVRTKEALWPAIREAVKESNAILIQKYICGREFSCAVMGNSHTTPLRALPPAEIISKSEFFDYEAKYAPETQEICPARISKSETRKIMELAKRAHEVLGCDGLTRSDFILTPRGTFYFLEINTIPGFTKASIAPKEARAAGMNFGEFLDKQIKLAMLKRSQRP